MITWNLTEHPEKGACGPGCVAPDGCFRGSPEGPIIVCREGRKPLERTEMRKLYSFAVSCGMRVPGGRF